MQDRIIEVAVLAFVSAFFAGLAKKLLEKPLEHPTLFRVWIPRVLAVLVLIIANGAMVMAGLVILVEYPSLLRHFAHGTLLAYAQIVLVPAAMLTAVALLWSYFFVRRTAFHHPPG